MYMKKNILNFALVAALMVGLGACVVSCKDDDDNEKTEEQKEQEAIAGQQKDNTFWAVVGQLVSMENYTDDYAGRTFTPTIGTEADGDPLTRIVSTNSMEAAVQNFLNLVNVGDAETVAIDENTISYEWKNDAVGTLTYRKTTDGTSWATVDVSISQVPTLRHIVYQSPEQGNQNGSVDGKAYYRFGDVVSREITVDGLEYNEYWICIRPAFGPEGKGDSHWACVNILPDKNIKHVHVDDDNLNIEDYYVPTGIGENKKQMQNFAELLYAIYRPATWEENISYYSTTGLFGPSGLPIFNDFHSTNLRYHNKHFWQKVQDAWDDLNIPDLALNTDAGYLPDFIDREGISLLCNGYSWWSSVSWNCKLYQYTFTNGTKDTEKSLHHADYTKPEKNVKDIDIDCRRMGQHFLERYNDFFGDGKPRWIFRTLTGKELASDGRWDNKQPIAGVTEVYRYYAYYPSELTKGDNNGHDPEVTEDAESGKVATNAPTNGMGTYQIGDVLMDEQGNRWFCIAGSPYYEGFPVTDRNATFITFGFNGINTNGNTVSGLPTEEELPELAYRLLTVIGTMESMKAEYQFIPGVETTLGKAFTNVLEYANIDMGKSMVVLDSTFVFTSKGKTWNSKSQSPVFNLAYNDGNTQKQAVARLIYDLTQAGIERDNCIGVSGKTYADMRFRCFKHYEEYYPLDIRDLTEDERGLGMTKYNLMWPMTTNKIYLQDVADQAKVTRYAAADKWSGLPLYVSKTKSPVQRTPMTTAAASAQPADFIGNFTRQGTPRTNMWGEPVWFIRVCKIEDKGGQVPNTIATDGRRFTIVHLQNDKMMYNGMMQAQWALNYSYDNKDFYLDNQQRIMPPIPGFDVPGQ